MSTIQAFFFIGIYFFYFISNNNCRLLTINIVSFVFFYYRESKPPFCLHYEKSSPVNIVYRKINWQNPASISAYTQYIQSIGFSNYVNHIRIILSYFLKTNIKLYCIYQYFMSINSFFNNVSVSRYSRPITVTCDPL